MMRAGMQTSVGLRTRPSLLFKLKEPRRRPHYLRRRLRPGARLWFHARTSSALNGWGLMEKIMKELFFVYG